MKVIPLNGTILERHITDNAIGRAAELKAVQDYNIMMGNIEDPKEGDEPNE